MTTKKFREMALSFAGAVEALHFDRAAFKVEKRRIFATLHESTNTANLKLQEIEQSVFCEIDEAAIYRVPNKWGLQGWTTFDLNSVSEEIMLEALEAAYTDVFVVRRINRK